MVTFDLEKLEDVRLQIIITDFLQLILGQFFGMYDDPFNNLFPPLERHLDCNYQLELENCLSGMV